MKNNFNFSLLFRSALRVSLVLFSVFLSSNFASADIDVLSRHEQSPSVTLGAGNSAWLIQPIGSGLSGTATDLSFYYNIVSTSTNNPHNASVYVFEYLTEDAYSQELAGNLQFPNAVKETGVSAGSLATGTILFDWDGTSGNLDGYTFNPSYWYMLVFNIQPLGGWGTYGTFEAKFLGSDQSYFDDDCSEDHYLNNDPGSPGCGSILTANFKLQGVGNLDVPIDVVTISSNIATSTTWYDSAIYKISGNVTVNSGVTLTIEEGTTIKFDTATSSGLTIEGTLNAIGTDTNRIRFTSFKDDLADGDSNNDSTSTNPSEGDWRGIRVNAGGVLNAGYSIFQYGGAGTDQAMIHNNGGFLIVATSVVAYSSTSGIKNSTGTTTLTSLDLGYNNYGLYVTGGNVDIENNNIVHHNTTYGIYNNTSNMLNAQNIFWGDNTGPYHATNTGGTGDDVSDYVDFTPWDTGVHFYLGRESVDEGDNFIYLATSTVTSFSVELSEATTTWNNLGVITIDNATSTGPSLVITDISAQDGEDLPYVGNYHNNLLVPNDDLITLNRYYMDTFSQNKIINVITHELGHALGLDHSIIGNIMYRSVTNQNQLGSQDIYDYYYLWP